MGYLCRFGFNGGKFAPRVNAFNPARSIYQGKRIKSIRSVF